MMRGVPECADCDSRNFVYAYTVRLVLRLAMMHARTPARIHSFAVIRRRARARAVDGRARRRRRPCVVLLLVVVVDASVEDATTRGIRAGREGGARRRCRREEDDGGDGTRREARGR